MAKQKILVVDDQPQNPMRNVQYSAPTDPVQGSSSLTRVQVT